MHSIILPVFGDNKEISDQSLGLTNQSLIITPISLTRRIESCRLYLLPQFQVLSDSEEL
jgi:hypothetical protein